MGPLSGRQEVVFEPRGGHATGTRRGRRQSARIARSRVVSCVFDDARPKGDSRFTRPPATDVPLQQAFVTLDQRRRGCRNPQSPDLEKRPSGVYGEFAPQFDPGWLVYGLFMSQTYDLNVSIILV